MTLVVAIGLVSDARSKMVSSAVGAAEGSNVIVPNASRQQHTVAAANLDDSGRKDTLRNRCSQEPSYGFDLFMLRHQGFAVVLDECHLV